MGIRLGIMGFGYMGHWHLRNAPRGKKEIIEKELPDTPAELTEYYESLRDAIDGKAEIIVKPFQVRRVFEILEAMLRSAKTGEQVRL